MAGNFDPNFQFSNTAPINMTALMALKAKNPSLFAGMSQKDVSTLAQAMKQWMNQNQNGQIGGSDYGGTGGDGFATGGAGGGVFGF
jgi:hypothetical protein